VEEQNWRRDWMHWREVVLTTPFIGGEERTAATDSECSFKATVFRSRNEGRETGWAPVRWGKRRG
jgi:hypothetical protein